GGGVSSVRISEERFVKLADAVAADFRREAGALVELTAAEHPEAYETYQQRGERVLFFRANGSYTGLYTCNNWTSDRLATAGVPTGLWTPFTWGVFDPRDDSEP
ncbi:MAG: DUF2459 domain-containing protein, partial [Planctomycetota bacterium]